MATHQKTWRNVQRHDRPCCRSPTKNNNTNNSRSICQRFCRLLRWTALSFLRPPLSVPRAPWCQWVEFPTWLMVFRRRRSLPWSMAFLACPCPLSRPRPALVFRSWRHHQPSLPRKRPSRSLQLIQATLHHYCPCVPPCLRRMSSLHTITLQCSAEVNCTDKHHSIPGTHSYHDSKNKPFTSIINYSLSDSLRAPGYVLWPFTTTPTLNHTHNHMTTYRRSL